MTTHFPAYFFYRNMEKCSLTCTGCGTLQTRHSIWFTKTGFPQYYLTTPPLSIERASHIHLLVTLLAAVWVKSCIPLNRGETNYFYTTGFLERGGMFCFSANMTILEGKSKDLLDLGQDNISKLSNMSTLGLSLQ